MSDALLSPQLLEKISSKISDQKNKPGLYIVATPIGNILDITFRALNFLKNAKYIFAEDTRQAKKLLSFYDIKSPLISCHEHNEASESLKKIMKEEGIYALISDAGTPLISDPGYKIVNWCIQNKINVFPIPGACSLIAGLSASGMETDNFMFYGFLPPKNNARKISLNKLVGVPSTMIFFESPKRVIETLMDMKEILGDRYCCICRELTKIFEEFKRGCLSELIEYFSIKEPIGELVIIVSGNKEISIDEEKIFQELTNLLENTSLSLRNASKHIAGKYHINKSHIYKKALEIKGK